MSNKEFIVKQVGQLIKGSKSKQDFRETGSNFKGLF